MLLCSSDVVSLTSNFFFEKFFELGGCFSGFSIVTFFLTLASILFEESKEIKNFRVWSNANDSFLLSSAL